MTASLKQHWLATAYVEIITSIVSGAPPPSVSQALSVPPVDTASSDATPSRKRIRRRGGHDASPSVLQLKRSEMNVWCAADLNAPESWNDSRWNTFTGAVISADSAPRAVGTRNKKVFNVVLQDSTGIVCVGGWNSHADELASTVMQLEHANEQETAEELWLRVDLFVISSMKNAQPDFCPIGIMQTIPAAQAQRNRVEANDNSQNDDIVYAHFGTQVSIVKESEARTPRMSRGASLRSSITGVTHFEALGNLHPPSRVNIVETLASWNGRSGRSADSTNRSRTRSTSQ